MTRLRRRQLDHAATRTQSPSIEENVVARELVESHEHQHQQPEIIPYRSLTQELPS